jgi:hypothetical protein
MNGRLGPILSLGRSKSNVFGRERAALPAAKRFQPVYPVALCVAELIGGDQEAALPMGRSEAYEPGARGGSAKGLHLAQTCTALGWLEHREHLLRIVMDPLQSRGCWR